MQFFQRKRALPPVDAEMVERVSKKHCLPECKPDHSFPRMGTPLFHFLPNDLSISVFQCLSVKDHWALARVNKHWRAMSQQQSSWKHKTLKVTKNMIKERGAPTKILKLSNCLEHIEIIGSQTNDVADYKSVHCLWLQSFTQLRSVRFSMILFGNITTTISSPFLSRVEFDRCHLSYPLCKSIQVDSCVIQEMNIRTHSSNEATSFVNWLCYREENAHIRSSLTSFTAYVESLFGIDGASSLLLFNSVMFPSLEVFTYQSTQRNVSRQMKDAALGRMDTDLRFELVFGHSATFCEEDIYPHEFIFRPGIGRSTLKDAVKSHYKQNEPPSLLFSREDYDLAMLCNRLGQYHNLNTRLYRILYKDNDPNPDHDSCVIYKCNSAPIDENKPSDLRKHIWGHLAEAGVTIEDLSSPNKRPNSTLDDVHVVLYQTPSLYNCKTEQDVLSLYQ